MDLGYFSSSALKYYCSVFLGHVSYDEHGIIKLSCLVHLGKKYSLPFDLVLILLT